MFHRPPSPQPGYDENDDPYGYWQTVDDEFYVRDVSGKEMVSIAIPVGLYMIRHQVQLRLYNGISGQQITSVRLKQTEASSFI